MPYKVDASLILLFIKYWHRSIVFKSHFNVYLHKKLIKKSFPLLFIEHTNIIRLVLALIE